MDLWTACRQGDATAVAALLHDDPSLATAKGGPKNREALLDCGFTPALQDPATAPAVVACARLLLEAGADPNLSFLYDSGYREPCPLSALYAASGHSNSPELTQLLLDHGADPDDGESLYHATEHRDHRCLKLLLDHGARIAGTNALHRMLDFDDLEGLQLMLDAGGDPNAPDNAGSHNALHHAACRGRDGATIDLLIAYGADVLARDAEGRSPYAKALLHGNTEAATALLRHGAIDDLSPKDRFLAACACGDAEYVAQHPFDIGALSADDQRVLPHAASHGHIDAVRLMLSLGFDLRTPDEHGATALHHACWWGHAACAEALLRAGAPVDLEDPIYGGDALGWALHGAESSSGPRDGHPAVVRLLLEAGAVQSPGGCQSAHEGVQAVLTAWNTQA